MVDEGRRHGSRLCALINLLNELDPQVENVIVNEKELNIFLDD